MGNHVSIKKKSSTSVVLPITATIHLTLPSSLYSLGEEMTRLLSSNPWPDHISLPITSPASMDREAMAIDSTVVLAIVHKGKLHLQDRQSSIHFLSLGTISCVYRTSFTYRRWVRGMIDIISSVTEDTGHGRETERFVVCPARVCFLAVRTYKQLPIVVPV